MTTIQFNHDSTLNLPFQTPSIFVKFGASIILGVLSAFALFVLMQVLIAQEEVDIQTDDILQLQNFVFTKPIETTIPKPDPVPKLKPPVKAPVKQTLSADPVDVNEVGNIGELDVAVETNTEITDWSSPKKSDDDAAPIVRIAPRYPMKAAQQGIEGWVKLSFAINELGGVEDVSVLDSEPKRIFDREAKKALARWKYQPKILDGQPIKQTGLTVQLDFTMQN